MGFMDAFKNEKFETPNSEGGLKKAAKQVTAEYKGKKVNVTVGTKVIAAANALRMPVSVNCQDG